MKGEQGRHGEFGWGNCATAPRGGIDATEDGPRLTLLDRTPMGARREKEARKTWNNMEENYGEEKVNAWMEIVMETSKDRRSGQNKMETR